MINIDTVGKTGLAIGLLGLAMTAASTYAVYSTKKKLDAAIKDISKDVDVIVPEDIVNAAVEKETERKVDEAVNKAVAKVSKSTENAIANRVKDEVSKQEDDIAKRVKQEIEEKDFDNVRAEVIDKAKTQVMRKFTGDLDDISSQFRRNLGSIRDIYDCTKEISLKFNK